MTTTAQQLIEGAYARSTANDPGKLATDGELLGVANRLYQMIYALAAVVSPERYVSRTTFPALSGSPAQATLANTEVIDIRRVELANGTKVTVIPLEERDRSWHLAPAMYREGGAKIVSRAAAAGRYGSLADPVAGAVLTAWILDSPADLTGLSSVLDARFPTRYVEYIIIEMAMYLSTKDQGRDAGEYAKLKETRDQHRAAFFQTAGLSTTALTSPHGGVIVQRLNDVLAKMGG